MALVPGLILVGYFYRRDVLKPEPKRMVLKVFLGGVMCTLPALLMEISLGSLRAFFPHPLFRAAFDAFVIAALSEELMKFLVVWFMVYSRPEFDEVTDGIVYTIAASMGFALLENILYVTQGGMAVALIRGFTAVPLHASASGIMGYYLGLSRKTTRVDKRQGYIVQGLLGAIVVHGIYDFFLFAAPHSPYPLSFGALLVVIVSMRQLLKLTAKSQKIDSSRY